MIPNLAAYFHVDVTTEAQLMSPPNEFMVIDQAAFSRKGKSRFTIPINGVLDMNKPCVGYAVY